MPPARRRIISCASCRRLRTRCEKVQGLNTCRRCHLLRIECSFTSPTERTVSINELEQPPQPGILAAPADELQPGFSERLATVEATLAEIRRLLPQATDGKESRRRSQSPRPSVVDRTSSPSSLSILDSPPWGAIKHVFALVDHPSVKSVQTAPISVVRQMKHHILGTSPRTDLESSAEDAITLGLISEGLSAVILRGFLSLSAEKYILSADLHSLRGKSPLLFATCLLVGLHTIPSLHNSQLHFDLYDHVREHLGTAFIKSPLPVETLLAFLMTATWNLTPQNTRKYIDSWLMSGTAIMHGMLTFDFEMEESEENEPNDVGPTIHELVQAWNLLSLTHLKFSVGTGRPPVMHASQRDGHQLNSRNYAFLDLRDKIILAELKLYVCVNNLIETNRHRSMPMHPWTDIESWWHENEYLDDLDSSHQLRFAYSCVNLTLARYALRSLFSPPCPQSIISSPATQMQNSALIKVALHHSHLILNRLLYVDACHKSREYSYYPQAYDFLMATNASITLIEFPKFLKSLDGTLGIMEKVHFVIQKSGIVDYVFQWSLNVMRRIKLERGMREEEGEDINGIVE